MAGRSRMYSGREVRVDEDEAERTEKEEGAEVDRSVENAEGRRRSRTERRAGLPLATAQMESSKMSSTRKQRWRWRWQWLVES